MAAAAAGTASAIVSSRGRSMKRGWRRCCSICSRPRKKPWIEHEKTNAYEPPHPFQPCLGPCHLVAQQIAMCGPVALLQMTLLSLVIHMSNIPSFPYRQVVSVATLTRQDGIDFLRLAPETGIVTETTCYPPS